MKKIKLLPLALAGLLSVSAVGCGGSGGGGSASGSDVIVIGGIGPLTGELATYGSFAINGAEMALQEAGTVLGKEIKFVKLDDKGDSTEAVNAYNRLVDKEKATAIIGAVTSGPTSSVATASQKGQPPIPIISPSATATDVTTYGNNVFRACFIDPFQGQAMANFATRSLSVKTAAVIYNTGSDYSIGLAEAFKATFEANGGTIAAYEAYGDADTDYKAQLTKISGTNPEVLFVPDYYGTVASIAKQAKDTGVTATLLGADGWDGVLGAIDDVSVFENTFFCNHYATDDENPLVQDFIKNYTEKYGETPNAFAALGYDAALIMVKAIENAGDTDRAKITEAIQNIQVSGVTGDVTFDENHNPIKSTSIIEIVGGKYVMSEKLNP